MIQSRIDRLPPATKETLQQAAVIGRTFWERILAAIHALSERLPDHLLDLQESQFVFSRAAREKEYIFKHVLTQEVAYESLLRRNRQVVHRRVAEAMERLFARRIEDYYDSVIHHWRHAEDKDKLLEYLILGGKYSQKEYRNQAALSYLEEALTLLPEGDARRPEIRLSLARVLDVMGRYHDALAHLDLALEGK